MGFDEAVLRCLVKYAVFTGRARPGEFWWFSALYGAVLAVAFVVLAVSAAGAVALFCVAGVLTPPALAVTVRRLHDIGASGWTLAFLVPVLGQVLLLAWLARPGATRRNRFGPEPGKAAGRFLLYAR